MPHTRRIFLVTLCLLLAGCPAQHRLYIHNKSDFTLSSAYENANLKPVKIRPGRTKYIWMRFGMEACFRLTIGESTKSYYLPREILSESKPTGYGGRLDIYFEYGQFHFQHRDGHWVQFNEIGECDYI